MCSVVLTLLDKIQDKLKGWASLIALGISLAVMIVQGVSKYSAAEATTNVEHQQMKTDIEQLKSDAVKKQELTDLKERLDRIENKLDSMDSYLRGK